MTLEGPLEAVRGFMKGSRLSKNQNFALCEEIVAEQLIVDADRVINKTGTIWETANVYENVYNVFDVAMYATRMTQRLHPAMINCIGAGEFSYE